MKEKRFLIMIENFDEDFEIIDEAETLKEAMEIAENYGREHYRCIWIEEVDEKDNVIKSYDVD